MSGRCSVKAACLRGVEAILVDVEVSVSSGLPGFFIVGMVDAAVQEAKERIRVALKESGFTMPNKRVLVNLAPSSLKKTGSGFDLAIAVGVLVASGQINPELIRHALFVGEVSLSGSVRSVSGMLAFALCARDYGSDLVCSTDAQGLMPIERLQIKGLKHLRDLEQAHFSQLDFQKPAGVSKKLDYADISSNEIAKRACQIAAAGQHGLLMMGPPGSGKTMLASRLPSILPPLDEDEKLRVALIHSVAGEDVGNILAGLRPFRSPHHSATAVGLVGGGNPVRPGEISLADGGVLFLDELPEFRATVLQQIRQPIEAGCVHISRADGTITFPARFMLIAAANPCACGYYGDKERTCTCTLTQVRNYQNRIGGPLFDRIDLHIDVRRVIPEKIISPEVGTSSETLREGVMKAREYASWRRSRESFDNTTQGLLASCHLKDKDVEFFESVAQANSLSGRAVVRVMSVARTIADIAQRQEVSRSDLCEALSFRLRERSE